MDLIKKWEDFGLLPNLIDTNIRLNIATMYEKTSQILVGDGPIYGSGDRLVFMIFPIIYRIGSTGVIINNIPDFIEKLKTFLSDNINLIESSDIEDFDSELYLTKLFTDDYIEWSKDNINVDPIKYINKHKL